MSLDVLIVDKAGNARDWCDHETGACYYARNKVIYSMGSVIKTYTGGKDKDGNTSQIDVSSIIIATGPVFGKEFYERVSVYTERGILYARDMNVCAYCAEQFPEFKLTIDHIIPRSKGGRHIWANTVAACMPCNHRKADRTPDEAKMPLMYVPYAPSLQEKLLLKNRKVIADQMEYLLAKIPKTSRVWKNPAYKLS